MKHLPAALKCLLSICLGTTLIVGCANADYDPGGTDNNNTSSDGNGNNNDSNSGTINENTGVDDPNVDNIELTGDICQDIGDIKTCDMEGNLITCKGGIAIDSQECPNGCINEQCKELVDNGCSNPFELTVGSYVEGNTSTGNSFSHACTDLKAEMGVVKFNITELGFYNIAVKRTTNTSSWGYLLARSCDPQTAYHPTTTNCSMATGSDSITRLLNPGEHYVFVAANNVFALDFEFEVEVNKTNPNSSYTGPLTPVYIPHGDTTGHVISDSTTDGASQKNWLGNLGCDKDGNNGPEKAYMIAVDKAGTLTARLKISDTSEYDNAALHLYKSTAPTASSAGTLGLLNCADEAASMRSITLKNEVQPGEYILFVDGSDGKSFDYELTLTLK